MRPPQGQLPWSGSERPTRFGGNQAELAHPAPNADMASGPSDDLRLVVRDKWSTENKRRNFLGKQGMSAPVGASLSENPVYQGVHRRDDGGALDAPVARSDPGSGTAGLTDSLPRNFEILGFKSWAPSVRVPGSTGDIGSALGPAEQTSEQSRARQNLVTLRRALWDLLDQFLLAWAQFTQADKLLRATQGLSATSTHKHLKPSH